MKLLMILLIFIAFISCSMTGDKERTKRNIYAKFMVSLGEDDTNKMQCVAEFMKDPDDLKKIALKKEARVTLDGQELRFDDSYYPNYVMERQPSEFIGKHKWKVDLGPEMKKEYEFEVLTFIITSAIPEKVGSNDLKIVCENLKSTDKIFLMLSGDLSANSETSLDIKPGDGYFLVPKTFFKSVDPVQLEMHFNISRVHSISDDDYFGKGVDIEWTKVTKRYKTTIIR